MDIFYHSSNFEQNVKNGQVGLLGFNSNKIFELSQRLPKRIWVVKTPRGMKGSIQLVASLLVSDEPTVAVNTEHPHLHLLPCLRPGILNFYRLGCTRANRRSVRLLPISMAHCIQRCFQGRRCASANGSQRSARTGSNGCGVGYGAVAGTCQRQGQRETNQSVCVVALTARPTGRGERKPAASDGQNDECAPCKNACTI